MPENADVEIVSTPRLKNQYQSSKFNFHKVILRHIDAEQRKIY